MIVYPDLLPEYFLGFDKNGKTCQFIRSPAGDDYLLPEDE